MFETDKLDSYFRRIAYIGSHEPSLSTLKDIAFAHATSIPFENLDVLAGLAISLELDRIFDKLVTRGRGGYCFEQNNLLGWALAEVGFAVQYLSARVWYNTPNGQTPPRTHVFLRVDLDGVPWLVDCGVGGSTPTGSMRLDMIGDEQHLPFEKRRIIQISGRLVPTFMHQVQHGDDWSDVYEFTGETMPKIDQAMGNWWTSTHPDSKFRKRMIVALLRRDGSRMSLVENEFIHRRGSEVIEQRGLSSQQEVDDCLAEMVGLIPQRQGWAIR